MISILWIIAGIWGLTALLLVLAVCAAASRPIPRPTLGFESSEPEARDLETEPEHALALR